MRALDLAMEYVTPLVVGNDFASGKYVGNPMLRT